MVGMNEALLLPAAKDATDGGSKEHLEAAHRFHHLDRPILGR
jgi:hypothetical protein